MYCEECKTEELVIGCPYCLKNKIQDLKAELDFYKNELEIIEERR